MTFIDPTLLVIALTAALVLVHLVVRARYALDYADPKRRLSLRPRDDSRAPQRKSQTPHLKTRTTAPRMRDAERPPEPPT